MERPILSIIFIINLDCPRVRVNTQRIWSVSDSTAIRNLITDGGRDAGPTTNYRPSELLRRYRGSTTCPVIPDGGIFGTGKCVLRVPSGMKISRRWTFNGRRADVLTRPDTARGQIFSSKPEEALLSRMH